MLRLLCVTAIAAATCCALLAIGQTAARAPSAASFTVLAAEPGIVPVNSARPLLLAGEQLVLTAATGDDNRFSGPAYALPRTGGRAVRLGRADAEDLRGVLSSGEIVAQGFELPLSGPAGGPLRPLTLPAGAPTDGTRLYDVYGDGDLVVLDGGDVFVRRAGRPERRLSAPGLSVIGVVGDLVVAESDGEDLLQVRSAATWKVIAAVKGLEDEAYAVSADGTVTYAQDDATIMRLSPGAARARRLGRITQLPAGSPHRLVVAGDRVVVGTLSSGVGVLERDGSSHLSGPALEVQALVADGDRVVWRGGGCVVALDPSSGPTAALPALRSCARTRIELGPTSLLGRRLTVDVGCLSGPSDRCAISVRLPGQRAVAVRLAGGEQRTVHVTLRRAPDRFVGVPLRIETSTQPYEPLRVTVYPDPPTTIPNSSTCSTTTFGAGDEEVAFTDQRGTTCARAEAVAKRLHVAPQSRLGHARAGGFACVRYPGSRGSLEPETTDTNVGTWLCRRGGAQVLVTLS